MFERSELQLVPLLRQQSEDSPGSRQAAQGVARIARNQVADRSLDRAAAGPCRAQQLRQGPRKGRFRSRRLGRGERDHRGRERIHGADARPGQDHRFFADSGDVDGQLRGRNPLSQPAGRRVQFVLRLVLRSSARLADDVGRTNRRAGKRGLVQLRLSDPLGIERAANPDPGRAFLYRSAVSRDKIGRDLPGLFGSRQIRRHLAECEARNRCRAGDGFRPRHPARVPHRPRSRVFRGLLPALFGSADARPARREGRAPRARPLPPRRRPGRQARRREQPEMEDGGVGQRFRMSGRSERIHRIPVGRTGQMESGSPRRWRRRATRNVLHRQPPRSCRRRIPLLRQRSDRILRDRR